MKSIYLLVIITLLAHHVIGQTMADSLVNALSKSNDTERAKLLLQISDELMYSDVDSAFFYAQKAKSIALELNDEPTESAAYQRIGKVFQRKGAYDSALYYANKSLKMWKRLSVPYETANLLNLIGIIYDEKGLDDKSIEYYVASLQIYDSINDRSGVAKVYNNLGIINKKNNNFTQVIYYYKKSVAIYEEINDGFGLAVTKLNIGSAYLELKRYEKSIEFSLESIKGLKENKAKEYMPYAYENIGLAYRALGDIMKSLNYHQKALKGYEEYGNQKEIAFTLISLSQISVEKKKYVTAKKYAKRSVKIASEIGALNELVRAYEALFIAETFLNKPQSAFYYHKKYKLLSDSMINEKRHKIIEEIQVKYETEKKEKEINMLTSQAEIQSLRIRNNQSITIAGAVLFLLLIISIIIFYKWKNIKLKIHFTENRNSERIANFNAVIHAQEEERKRIAKDLHDGIVQQLGGLKLRLQKVFENTKEEEPKSIIHSLDESAKELRTLSHQMMPRALSELGLIPAMEDMLANSLNGADIAYQFENFGITSRLAENIEIAIFRISQELINNVIKHSRATQVNIQLFKSGSQIIFIVEDNGKGIEQNNNKKGIGLMNISSRLDTINGNVNYEPSPESGTLVTIKIPLKQS